MEHRRLVAMLAATPLRLRLLLGGLTPEATGRSPVPGEWSAAQVVLHLAERERDAFVPRLRRMVSEETPVFSPITPQGGAEIDARLLLDVFAQARGHAVSLLEGLSLGDWGRDGVIPSRGAMTVEAYGASTVAHDREHLRQLNHVRWALGRRPLRCEAGDPLPLAGIAASIAATGARIGALVAGLDAGALAARPASGEWSMKEVMAHLMAVETRLFLPRLRRLRDHDWPEFEPFDPDAWAAERDWRQGDFAADLAAFRRTRAETVALLQGLEAAALERMGVSRVFGAVTLHEYATHVAEHDLEHLAQLEAARRTQGSGDPRRTPVR